MRFAFDLLPPPFFTFIFFFYCVLSSLTIRRTERKSFFLLPLPRETDGNINALEFFSAGSCATSVELKKKTAYPSTVNITPSSSEVLAIFFRVLFFFFALHFFNPSPRTLRTLHGTHHTTKQFRHQENFFPRKRSRKFFSSLIYAYIKHIDTHSPLINRQCCRYNNFRRPTENVRNTLLNCSSHTNSDQCWARI